ncbi:hypothetical protein J4573_49330 [Actinomadura barringtoniae]|uniref:Uncharacterized protein n=1 Tax=Actinomadura barringtoniae TaxID=1427535 RepID=A0A939T6N9_9ACTN|nr:hypothetical protein [Actinomadura barringtoniae]MBO2455166.1 hypothetical protein [Actinomadura barringtoniae]
MHLKSLTAAVALGVGLTGTGLTSAEAGTGLTSAEAGTATPTPPAAPGHLPSRHPGHLPSRHPGDNPSKPGTPPIAAAPGKAIPKAPNYTG